MLKCFTKSLLCETSTAGQFSLSLIGIDPFETENDTMDFLDHTFLYSDHKSLCNKSKGSR